MKTKIPFFIIALAWMFPIGCGAPTNPTVVVTPLMVTSFSPEDGVVEEEDTIRIQFDQPVVGEDELGVSLENPPVQLEPDARVAAMWDDRQTLVVTATDNLEPSTRYAVHLVGDLAPRIEGSEEYSFVYRPLKVDEHFGVNTYLADPATRIGIRFNQEVRAADLEDNCTIEEQSGDERMPVNVSDDELVGAEMIVSPSRKLKKGTWYDLVCDGLSGAKGDEEMEDLYELRFRTYPDFEVTDSRPTGDDIWSDEVEIEIAFTTPVEGEVLRDAISSKPAIKGIEKGTLSGDGTLYRVVVDLKSSTEYQVGLDRGFKDAFGQKLDSRLQWNFTTGQARPRLVMETGIFAVEAKKKSGAYPVWTRNLGRFDVECAGVPKKKVVDLLTGSMNYDPWYDAGDNSDLKWKKMGLKRKKRRVRIKEVKDKWHLEELNFNSICGGKGKTGLFLAELKSDQVKLDEDYPWRYHPRRRVLANVTDLGVLLKAGSASGVTWVTSLSDGKPVEGAKVSVYTPRGRRAFTGETDGDGILKIPGADELLRQPGAGDKDAVEDDWGYDEYDTWRARRVIVLVEKDGDMAVLDGNWANGIQIWNFGVPADYRGGQTRYRGFILSDRGIYRPGETVHFKGLIREVALDSAPSVPIGARVAVHVEDARGATVYERRHRLSEFGGFGFDLPVGPDATLGDYYVTATVKGQVFRESFMVEEFRKVTYELELDTSKRHTQLGRKIKFDLKANYLFGAPVADADVEWTAMRRPHYLHFKNFPDYNFSDDSDGYGHWGWYRDDYAYSSFVSDGAGETSGRGKYRFSVLDDSKSLNGPQDYIIQVSAQDSTGETVSKRKVVTAHKTDSYVGLHAQEWVQAVGMPFSVNTVAVSPDGKQVGLKGTLSYVRERQKCTYEKRGYRTYPSCKVVHDKVWSRSIDIPATGSGTERIMPKEPGEYVIRLEGRDSKGTKIAASRFVWVLGKGEAFWSGDESARMSLVASKSSYKPGEKAKIAPRSSLGPSSALVTLERNGIIDAFVTPMGSSGQGIEIPIEESHAPNVFASVAMVKGRTGEGDRYRPRFQMGVVELKVSTDHQLIDVVVETDKKTYEPGEKVTGTIKTKSRGKPIKAEVCVSVADEGVLQLIAYKTPDPMKTFYSTWGLGVDSSTNLNRISRLNDPREIDPDEGGDSGDGGGPEVRSRFVSSAFWASALVTDEEGVVHFDFVAPDNLTAFRVMAVAADTGARFGSSEKRFTVKKPLLAKPLLPRFLSTDDRAFVGVDVKNLTGKSGEALVTARATGAKLEKKKKKIKLRKDGSAQVRFPVVAGMSKKATFTFSVTMGEHSDALKLAVPIERPLVYDKETVSKGSFSGEIEVPISWDDDVIDRESTVEVMVDRTGMAELGPSLKYLIEYPYGCLEQTMSRLIPLLKVEDLAKSLKIEELRGPKLRQFIKLGVAKVARHQHQDGHFSLWPGGSTYPHLTVYALYGLNEAKRAGVKVDDAVIRRGISALKSWINTKGHAIDSQGEGGTLAMAAYVLAELGEPDTGLNARLFEKRAGLPVYGRAFLLSAMAVSGGDADQIEILRSELSDKLVKKGGTLSVEERSGLRRYMSSNVRSSAITMSALIRVDADGEEIPKLAEGLRKAQKPGGYWRSTQDNLYALVALADYARSQEKGSASITVSMKGKKLVTKKITGNQVVSVSRTLSRIEPGDLVIKTTGPARHTVRLVEARRVDGASGEANGFSLKREYLDVDTGEPVKKIRVGDLLKVKVVVEASQERNYVAVVDPLPAGLEAVNTRLATSVNEPHSSYDDHDYWYWRPGWTYRELRDDSVQAFADTMRKGTLELEYLARAITPGTFTAAPAIAEAMYQPEINGRTEAAVIEVEK